jgi:GGDEF domain-containing protein
MFPGMNVAETTERLALITAALEDASEHGSVTVGLAQLQPGDSPEDLVARADAALYRERQARGPHTGVEPSACERSPPPCPEEEHGIVRQLVCTRVARRQSASSSRPLDFSLPITTYTTYAIPDQYRSGVGAG